MNFVKVTSYLKDDSYTADDGGLLVKDRLREVPALVNFEDVVFVFPSQNGTAGSMIRFRNGVTLDIKETVEELEGELIVEPFSLGIATDDNKEETTE